MRWWPSKSDVGCGLLHKTLRNVTTYSVRVIISEILNVETWGRVEVVLEASPSKIRPETGFQVTRGVKVHKRERSMSFAATYARRIIGRYRNFCSLEVHHDIVSDGLKNIPAYRQSLACNVPERSERLNRYEMRKT